MQNKKKYILVHCSDVRQSTIFDQYESINKYHKEERDFPLSITGSYVGYHYLITGGKLYTCKQDWEIGAHCNMVKDGLSMNYQALGVCWGGDGDEELPTDEHYKILQKTIKDLMYKHGISINNVMFHRDFDNKGKTCPGALFTRKYLDDMIVGVNSETSVPKKMCTEQEETIKIQNGVIENLKALLQSIINLYKK